MIGTVARHIHSILVQMMTSDRQNKQTDPFRVWGTFGFLTVVGFMGFAIYKGQSFDPLAYGGALSAYFVAWGTAIFAKDKVSK